MDVTNHCLHLAHIRIFREMTGWEIRTSKRLLSPPFIPFVRLELLLSGLDEQLSRGNMTETCNLGVHDLFPAVVCNSGSTVPQKELIFSQLPSLAISGNN